MAKPVTPKLTPSTIAGFSYTYLYDFYDDARKHPRAHFMWWDHVLSDDPMVAIEAPRGHGKTTGVTLVYTLAAVLFRVHDYVIIQSNTEDAAKQFLKNLVFLVENNKKLRRDFEIKRFVTNSAAEVVIEFKDGKQFCIKVRSATQQIRGTLWNLKRPNLVLIDDFEDPQEVQSDTVRKMMHKRLKNDIEPAVSSYGKIRMVGTILHNDSVLARRRTDPRWKSYHYEACDEKFENILWPESWTKEELMLVQSSYEEEGNPEGFLMEYRNKAVDESTAILSSKYWQEYDEDEVNLDRFPHYVVIDAAVSTKTKADYTAIGIFCVDDLNRLFCREIIMERMDSYEWTDLLFQIYTTKPYSSNIMEMLFEEGVIEKAVGPWMEREMNDRGIYLPIEGVKADIDKIRRSTSLKSLWKAKAIYMNKEIAELQPEVKEYITTFPHAKHDDVVDILAYIAIKLHMLIQGKSQQEVQEEAYDRAEDEYDDLIDNLIDDETGYLAL